MAVDTTQLTSIYNSLSTATKATLDEQWNDQRLRGADYANVVAQTMIALIQTSAQLLQVDAQLAEQSSQTTAERNEKAREFDAQLTQDAPVKTAQASLIAQQELTEIEKAALTARQTQMYNDNLRVEKAKQTGNVTGMYGVGGTELPNNYVYAADGVTVVSGSSLSEKLFDALDAITTTP